MNILFICSRNKWRSRTAETIYKDHPTHKVRSAGTEPSAQVKVSAKLILWADLIFVMENKHRQRIIGNFPAESENKKLVVLNIEDDYKYIDEYLVEMIRAEVAPYLTS